MWSLLWQVLCALKSPRAAPGLETAYFSALTYPTQWIPRRSFPSSPPHLRLRDTHLGDSVLSWHIQLRPVKHRSPRNSTPWHRLPKVSRIQLLLTSVTILVQATIISHVGDYNGLLPDFPMVSSLSPLSQSQSFDKWPLRLYFIFLLYLSSFCSPYLSKLTSYYSLLATSSCLRAFVQFVPFAKTTVLPDIQMATSSPLGLCSNATLSVKPTMTNYPV